MLCAPGWLEPIAMFEDTRQRSRFVTCNASFASYPNNPKGKSLSALLDNPSVVSVVLHISVPTLV